MKQIYLVPTRYGSQPRGAYVSFKNAAAACEAFGANEKLIEAVPVLDSEQAGPLDAWPYDAMAEWLRKQGGERDGL